MPMSEYMRTIRAKVGHTLLIVPSVTVLNYDDAGRVMLVRHSEGNVWVAPGGMVEPDETPADAAVREMREETGLDVGLSRIAGVYGGPEFRIRYNNGDEMAFVMTVFESRTTGGAPRPDGDETLEVGYFTSEEAASLDVGRWMPVVLADAFEQGGEARFTNPADAGQEKE